MELGVSHVASSFPDCYLDFRELQDHSSWNDE